MRTSGSAPPTCLSLVMGTEDKPVEMQRVVLSWHCYLTINSVPDRVMQVILQLFP